MFLTYSWKGMLALRFGVHEVVAYCTKQAVRAG